MGDEASKALRRRLRDPRYASRWFVGAGIDVGAGQDGLGRQREHWPGITSMREWDLPDGDAQVLATIPNDSFDFLHSSHCLEHMRDPWTAMDNWIRVVRPGGHLVILVPDEDMYEQGVFPSTFNGDHKTTWTVYKRNSWSPCTQRLTELLGGDFGVELLKLDVDDIDYDWTAPRRDQTGGDAACAIEVVLRKRRAIEAEFGGRVWSARAP